MPTAYSPTRPQPQARGAATKAPPAQWSYRTVPEPRDAALAARCDISPVTAAVLRARGHETPEQVLRFLQPPASALRDPRLMPDVDVAVERLHRAIVGGEAILIHGDYDVDGISATALLVRALRALKANVAWRIPERSDGYGLSEAAVEAAAQAGIALIVTADCGITAHGPVLRGRELGLDIIITDHHEPMATLPAALAVLNPRRADSRYGFGELCGCAVAYKLMQALMLRHWPRHAGSFDARFIELVGLATLADCVPLVDENRALAAQGLRRLARTGKHGLQALTQSARLKVNGDTLTGRHVSFGLAPRLNAAGRVGSATLGLELLLSSCPDESRLLAGKIEEHNRLRQECTVNTFQQALQSTRTDVDLARDCIVVVAGEGWNKGIVGLVASRLVERFARPAIVLDVADGVAHGSGRSIDGFDLQPLLEATRDLLRTGGGHHAACGLSLDADKVDEFRRRALEQASTQLRVADLTARVEADCLIDGLDITPQLIADIEKLEPCGQGNPEPRFMIERAQIVDGRALGSAGEHLKWRILCQGHEFDALWWRPGDRADGFAIGQHVDLCFVPELNEWNGNVRIQLNIKEARAARGVSRA